MTSISAAPTGYFDWAATTMRVGRVHLKVRDLARVAGFYRDSLGLTVLEQTSGRIGLGVGDSVMVDLIGDPGFAPLDRRAAGLFHTAFLLPTRADLGRWLGFAAENGIGLAGAADHKVSEAVYLADPEGNGIEIYADRPMTEWGDTEGGITMSNAPLDLPGLVAAGGSGAWTGMPADGIIGHVHLQVGDLAQAGLFYGDVLGFDVTCRYTGATFFGADGYHHQLATNIWNSRDAGPRSAEMAGLDRVDLVVPDDALRARIADRAHRNGLAPARQADRLTLTDLWGSTISLGAV